ncbi:SsgA family sporulation/cell division regulator [Streptomyces sp. LP05-1]|uniref:SsgA family sporulation/cell division regulator n=1 Tax=Streptomyces pyxinae TaxID=2970734 RepID=A0ABT2CCD8_9ACTN|nr:SsgA family sporulation/cell division regulator [Streptomyces sp. LP05-1]MCS0635079.1 SsgA family sporulation/cell division regulator [Streptomyces sp. LP05-1]
MKAVLRDKVFMRLLAQSGHDLPVLAQLTYEADDPYAVRVGFLHDGLLAAEWRLSREMLAEGMRGEVGIGDVRMWPHLNGSREELRIELLRSAVFTVWAPSLRKFLDRTYEEVPAGQERLELDAFLAEVLAAG